MGRGEGEWGLNRETAVNQNSAPCADGAVRLSKLACPYLQQDSRLLWEGGGQPQHECHPSRESRPCA